MTSESEPLWTIDELGAQVALALSVDYPGQVNGRVRAVPDRRTIRYYTTLGLMDHPAEMRGRTGLYGRKHLLQLVAIKRLQARGMPLAEIQERLLGLPLTKLRQLASLPAGLEMPVGDSVASLSPAGPVPEICRRRFWGTVPEPPAPGGEPETGDYVETGTSAVLLQNVPLDDGVQLVLAVERPVDEEDLSAIRLAAAPLLKLLEVRRLRPRTERRQT